MAIRKITKKDNGTHIHLKAGDRLEIVLAENATTGYKWQLPGMTDIQVKETLQTADANIPGSSGTTCFQLVPLLKMNGRKITLKYQRPWETTLPAEDSFSFTLSVQ
jgi:predicted secreted protein